MTALDPPPLQETWSSRELPILAAALRHVDAGESYVDLRTIQAEVALEEEQVRVGLEALESAVPPYLDIMWLMGGELEGHISSVSERARRELGTWPTPDDIVTRLVAALETQATNESDPEKRSKIMAAAAVMGGIARQVLVAVISQKLGTAV